MTNRIGSLLVVLENDVREDEVDHLLKAISLIRGVMSVAKGPVMDGNAYVLESRIKRAVYKQLTDLATEMMK